MTPLPTAYERYCAEACEWCAKGFGMSGNPNFHWTGSSTPPQCTSLPLAQWAEQQAARVAELVAAHQGLVDALDGAREHLNHDLLDYQYPYSKAAYATRDLLRLVDAALAAARAGAKA